MPLVHCAGCSRKISDAAAACPGCMRPTRAHLSGVAAEGDAMMEGLRAYVGRNWESHYCDSFGELLSAEREGTAPPLTWNTSAALTPLWFLYRKLYIPFVVAWWVAWPTAWCAAAFLLVLVPRYSYGILAALVPLVGGTVVSGFLGDRLLFAEARRVVGYGTANPAELAARGAPLRWVAWTATAAAVLTIFVVATVGVVADRARRAEMASVMGTVRPVARADGWVDFESRKGGFKAAFPQAPLYGTNVGGSEHQYAADHDRGELRVTFGDEYDAGTGIEEHLRRIAEAEGGRGAIRPTPVSLGRHPGMEATYERGEGVRAMVVHHRVFQVDGRLYQLVASMYKSDPAEDDVERFFSSFALTSS